MIFGFCLEMVLGLPELGTYVALIACEAPGRAGPRQSYKR